jgi:Esterase-like activity of phytase
MVGRPLARVVVRSLLVALLACAMAMVALRPVVGAQVEAPSAQVVAVGLFPEMSIGNVQNAVLPQSVPNDRRILLGGVGSDVWHGPNDPPNEVWLITDRGPPGEDDNGKNRLAFAIPEYTPMILHVRLDGPSVELLEVIPIVGESGQPVTGLPNVDGRDDRPVDYRAKGKLPFNASGLDPEGLVRAPGGDFWVADEYGPSLVHVGANGVVLARYIPESLPFVGADYPVVPNLPGIFAKRAHDGGFEGITITPDGATIFLAMQGPLSNPGNDTGDKSRNTRILAFDVASAQVSAEYVYRFEAVRAFDPSKKADPEDMKLSALALAGDGRLLVLEASSNAARLYLADASTATNILGSAWDDAATRPTLEAADNLVPVGVRALTKTLAVDLTNMPGVPDKLEGLAILDSSTIVVANDNDFDIGKFDKNGDNVGQGDRSQIVTISLAQPLP